MSIKKLLVLYLGGGNAEAAPERNGCIVGCCIKKKIFLVQIKVVCIDRSNKYYKKIDISYLQNPNSVELFGTK